MHVDFSRTLWPFDAATQMSQKPDSLARVTHAKCGSENGPIFPTGIAEIRCMSSFNFSGKLFPASGGRPIVTPMVHYRCHCSTHVACA